MKVTTTEKETVEEQTTETVEEQTTETETEKDDDTDYKTLYEDEKQRADKYEGRFKSTAKQLNETKKQMKSWSSDTGDVAEMVSQKVQEELYYANNPVAKEYKSEIREIQSKHWLSPEDAMTFYLAKNKPELISKQNSDTWVDWVYKSIDKEEKSYAKQAEEELEAEKRRNN